ncbi:hypothetical protein HJFPF1_12907 [Paramyrothecium foliicola]|nr:hypothetical protein HJFPF1_12907 [Paramyrothecium foliicola]
MVGANVSVECEAGRDVGAQGRGDRVLGVSMSCQESYLVVAAGLPYGRIDETQPGFPLAVAASLPAVRTRHAGIPDGDAEAFARPQVVAW